MRWMLAMCVAAGCALCGTAMAAGVRRRVAALKTLIYGLKALRVHMLRMLEPAAQALKAANCPILERVGAGMGPGVGAGAAWEAVRDGAGWRGNGLEALTGEDRRVLDGLFGGLGEIGKAQQEIELRSAIQSLEQNLTAASASAGEAERLYGTLGLLVGLMLAMIAV